MNPLTRIPRSTAAALALCLALPSPALALRLSEPAQDPSRRSGLEEALAGLEEEELGGSRGQGGAGEQRRRAGREEASEGAGRGDGAPDSDQRPRAEAPIRIPTEPSAGLATSQEPPLSLSGANTTATMTHPRSDNTKPAFSATESFIKNPPATPLANNILPKSARVLERIPRRPSVNTRVSINSNIHINQHIVNSAATTRQLAGKVLESSRSRGDFSPWL